MREKIGDRLRLEREGRKMTQVEFAEMLNMSASTLSRLETGKVQPSMEELAGLCEKLNLNITDFFPDNLSNRDNRNQHGGIIFGNYIFNANNDEKCMEMQKEIDILKREIELKDEMLELLKAQMAALIQAVGRSENQA